MAYRGSRPGETAGPGTTRPPGRGRAAGSAASLVAVALAGVVALIAPARAQDPNEALSQCQDQSMSPSVRTTACTTVIERGDADRKAEAHLNRGLLREQAGELDGALDDYSKAIELDGENENAWFNRGNVHEALGQLEKAIRDFDKAIALNPNDADFFNNRGRAWDSLGETKKAVEDFTMAIKVNPRHAMAHFNRGLGHAELGHHDKAVPDFDLAASLGIADADLWTARAGSLEALGRAAEAVQSLEKAIAANPEHEQAREALARLKK